MGLWLKMCAACWMLMLAAEFGWLANQARGEGG